MILKNKIFVFLYFFCLSLPLIIGTFDTVNWSDDFNRPIAFALKAKFSPAVVQIFSPYKKTIEDDLTRGAHFSPMQNVPFYLATLSYDPRLFHLMVVFCFILTAFFVFLLVQKYYKDDRLALLAGSLFAVNYYVGFKSLTWNGFHGHCTNTMNGVISLYCLVCYLQDRKKFSLLFSCFFLLLAIFGMESGFVFFVVLLAFLFYSFLKKKIQAKQFASLVLIFSLVVSVYPMTAYARTGEFMPMAARLKVSRNLQNYVFNAQQLFINSTGLTIFYDKLIFNPLRTQPELKEPIVKLIKQNKASAIREIPFKLIFLLGTFGLLSLAFIVFLIRMVLTRTREETRPFIFIYFLLFAIYIYVFYRVDVTNAIGVFSSIIFADCIMSFLRDPQKISRNIGLALIGLYVIATSWTVFDQFEDAYEMAYGGISRIAIQGPQKIYDAMNKKIGHYIEHGLLLFMHDYSAYHRTIGFERIGDMIGLGDFICYNAAIFEKDFLKHVPEEYRNLAQVDFEYQLSDNNPYNRIVIVSSQEEAIDYLKRNHVDMTKFEAVYMTKDYHIVNLRDAFRSPGASLLKDRHAL